MLLIHKIFCKEYDTIQFSMIEYHTLDTLLFAAFMWIFRPRELPANFTADLGDFSEDNNKYLNIYKSYIDRFEDITFKKEDIEIPSKEISKYKKDKDGVYPLIVLNPTFGNTGGNNNKPPEYYSSITYKCDHIQVGYSKKD